MRLAHSIAPLLVAASMLAGCPAPDEPPPRPAAPRAVIAPLQSVRVGTLVALDGTQSTTSTGVALSYFWTLLAPPTSHAALDLASAAMPSFVADVAGTYTIRLMVSAGGRVSAPTTVVLQASAGDVAPRAAIEADAQAALGAVVVVDGAGSSDADGDALVYRWTLQAPDGSQAALDHAGAVAPRFTADVAGRYVVTLVVNDGQVDSAPVTATIEAVRGNVAPVADAGPSQVVVGGSTVTLDGRASHDADQDPLTYRWTLQAPSGSSAALDDAHADRPSFRADVVGRYQVTLVVNDGRVDSAPAAMFVDARDQPVADIAVDFAGTLGSVVKLDGGKSKSPAGGTLTYRWTLVRPDGSHAALDASDAAAPTFFADVAGSYGVTLVVSDGALQSQPKSVTVIAQHRLPGASIAVVYLNCRAQAAPSDSCPVVSQSRGLRVGDTVLLSGKGSWSSDGGMLRYQWTVTDPSGAPATVTTTSDVQTFVTVALAGDYHVSLLVNDGFRDSVPATATFSATVNHKPVAVGPAPRTVPLRQPVRIDVSGSDADGDSFEYLWDYQRPAGSHAVLNISGGTATFTPDVEGVYLMNITPFDYHEKGDPAVVTVTASGFVVDAGPHRTIATSAAITLAGSASDTAAPGTPLTYAWHLVDPPAGGNATLTQPTTLTPGFSAQRAGDYTVQLDVTDPSGQVVSAQTVIRVQDPQAMPVLLAPQPPLHSGTALRFGQSSSDAIEPATLRYQWSIDFGSYSLPADETLARATMTMTPGSWGTVKVTLTVTDPSGGHASSATVSETIQP